MRLVRPIAAIAVLPAIWLLVQAIPLPVASLQHPIWVSARSALDTSLAGSVSVSPGSTLVALSRYLSAFGLFFVALTATIDRQRAEMVLFMLAGISTLLAVVLIVHDLGGFLFLGELSEHRPARCNHRRRDARHRSHNGHRRLRAGALRDAQQRGEFGFAAFIVTVASSAGAFMVCWIAIALFTSGAAIFAAATGVGTFALIVGFRRLGLGPNMGYVLVAIGLAVPLSLIARDLLAASPDITLRFDAAEAQPTLAMAQRVISDTGFAGSGGGTFRDLLPIYQDAVNAIALTSAPTTAAGLLIEFRPCFRLSGSL